MNAMADFLMPALGADMETGRLVQWLVKPGDRVMLLKCFERKTESEANIADLDKLVFHPNHTGCIVASKFVGDA